MARSSSPLKFDVAIVDESQDFSANQLRAVRHHLSDEYAATFVTDTVQRIYARGYAWSELGFDMRGARYRTLKENHRNTVEIAAFAAGLPSGMSADADGALPAAATRRGTKPNVIRGMYNEQISWVTQHILHPNSAVRPEEQEHFDKSKDWLDHVNLSVSEINSRFFRLSSSWSHNQTIWLALLGFDPVIATHPGVYFATTNCKHEHCTRMPGPLGFKKKLFGDRIFRTGSWSATRTGRAKHLPTCEQAEVLYPKVVSTEFLRRIYVRKGEHSDLVRGWLRDFEVQSIEVIVQPQKFAGAPN